MDSDVDLEIAPTCRARDGPDSKIFQGLGIRIEALQLLEEIAAHAGEGGGGEDGGRERWYNTTLTVVGHVTPIFLKRKEIKERERENK